jgi:hypothetical protein
MNRPRAHPVLASILHPREVMRIAAVRAALVGGFLLAFASPGCIEIDGGAVELSWSLRSFDGDAVDGCGMADIQEVRLCWEHLPDGSVSVGGGSCRSGARRTFPCSEYSGITGFQLDPGATAFWIEPVCDDGEPADAETYQVPPPIVRNVEEGKIVSLNSLLLVVSPPGGECPPAGCTCQ